MQHWRKTRTKPTTPLREEYETADEPTGLAAHQRQDQQEIALPYLLSQISEEEQQMLLMKYWQSSSIEELQQAFHLPSKSAVKMRLHRSRQKLLHLYERAGYFSSKLR